MAKELADVKQERDELSRIIRQQQLMDEEMLGLKERIRQLEAVVTCPQTLWANWLRGSVALPKGIGDVRQYQERIRRLEEFAKGIAENYDCDADAHRYGTTCRCCEARRVLAKEAKP
jgi:hypothetical protein